MAQEDILPNCLTRERKQDSGMGSWFYLFCANCGCDGGRVMETYLPEQFAFYLCVKCAEKYGEIANTWMVPDHMFWQEVNSRR